MKLVDITLKPTQVKISHSNTLKMRLSLYCFHLLFLLSSYLFLFYFFISQYFFFKRLEVIQHHLTAKEDIYSILLLRIMFNESSFNNVVKVTRLRQELAQV